MRQQNGRLKKFEDVREAGANWTRRRVRRSRSGDSIYAYAALLPLQIGLLDKNAFESGHYTGFLIRSFEPTRAR